MAKKKTLEQYLKGARALLYQAKRDLRSTDPQVRARARKFFRESDRLDREITAVLAQPRRT